MDNAGVKLLAAVIGFWIVMRAVNRDSSGRTLIDHILGQSGGANQYIPASTVGAGTGTGGTNQYIPASTVGAGTGTGGTNLATGNNPRGVAITTGYTNPFARARGLVPERTDMGVDASMQPGSPILAPADSTLVNVVHNWFRGEPMMVMRINSGTDKGKLYYLAEQIVPSLHVGQTVAAGQPIATYASSGTGIEMGWAANNTQTLAQATTGYKEGEVTAAGKSFRKWLESLGAHV